MKMRLGFLFTLLFLAAFASAQSDVPAAPIAPILHFANEISVNSAINFHTNFDTGYGISADASHYFNRFIGITADSEYLTSNVYDLTEYAFRAGPIVRFYDSRRLTFFARGLGGYARYKATYTALPSKHPVKGPYPYENAPSLMFGVGADVHILGHMSARIAGDCMEDIGSRNNGTRLLRLSMGLAYSFGTVR